MVPTKALLDAMASLFALDASWSTDGNDDPAKMVAITNDFTASPGIAFADLTLNTANLSPPGAAIFPNAVPAGVDCTNGEYVISLRLNAQDSFFATGLTGPLTIYGWALVKVGDDQIVATIRNATPVMPTADGQFVPHPTFDFRWPANMIR